jgi:hypothetical protein
MNPAPGPGNGTARIFQDRGASFGNGRRYHQTVTLRRDRRLGLRPASHARALLPECVTTMPTALAPAVRAGHDPSGIGPFYIGREEQRDAREQSRVAATAQQIAAATECRWRQHPGLRIRPGKKALIRLYATPGHVLPLTPLRGEFGSVCTRFGLVLPACGRRLWRTDIRRARGPMQRCR